MSGMAEVLLALVSAVVGWAALWPLRRQLGSFWYHAFAMPVGLLSWSIAAAVSSILQRPFGLMTTLAGLLLFILLLHGLARRAAAGGECVAEVRWSSFVIYFVVLGVSALVLTISRLTVASGDSWADYWPLAVNLSRKGALGYQTMAGRGVPLVALGAAKRLFGGGWMHAVYPLMAGNLSLILAGAVLGESRRRLRAPLRAVVAGIVLLPLLLSPVFLFNAFYVHSHIITALYLAAALIALRRGYGGQSALPAWLIVGGVCSAGLAIARPDGLAFVYIPVLIAVSMSADRGAAGEMHFFFTPMLAVIGWVFGAAWLELGFWTGRKLTGSLAAVLISGLVVMAALPAVLAWLKKRAPHLVHRDLLLAASVLGSVLLLGLVVALRWETARLMFYYAWLNLFTPAGGWGHLSYWLAGSFVLAMFAGGAFRRGSWARVHFSSIALFLVMVLLVNSSRGGREGYNDSLNRMLFHVLPLIVWYLGATLWRIIDRVAPSFAFEREAGE